MIPAIQAVYDAAMRPEGDPITPHAFPKNQTERTDNVTYAALFAQVQASNKGATYA